MLPSESGFRMPAEFSPHQRTYIEWPVYEAKWPGPFREVLEAFADIAGKISLFEPITVLANPDTLEQAKEMCGPGIHVIQSPHDDSWMRDNGPTFVVHNDGGVAGIRWRFNAWGGKYECARDRQVAGALIESLGIKKFEAPFVMEGGSFHVDGEGTLLTTEECLLNKNRNPHLSKREIENYLKAYLGVRKIIWLKKGLFGDDTDGHVDNVACFAKPGTIILQTARDPEDPNYERTLENLALLREERDATGRQFQVVEIPQPAPDTYEGTDLTLSYVNFYFVNGGIILPIFSGKHRDTDRDALNILRELFPERRIVTIDGMPIIRGGGNIHCITQQMPLGRSRSTLQMEEL